LVLLVLVPLVLLVLLFLLLSLLLFLFLLLWTPTLGGKARPQLQVRATHKETT
jgi:hypothetical protein